MSTNTGYRRLFRNRHFMALWVGQAISFTGDYFHWLAVPIMVERLTGSTLLVGLSLISTALPALFLGPVAGVFVDRWDRRKTMIVADLLRAVLVLLALTVHTADQVWVYYVVGFLMSCVSRFFFPSMNAVLPLIVEEDDLIHANGLMQMVQTVGLLAGPALAGFAIGLSGASTAFLLDSGSFLLSALAVATMSVPHTTKGAAQVTVRAVLGELREGLAYLFGSRLLTSLLICMSVIHLGLGGINAVWVPYLSRFFGVGPAGLGLVDSAQGVGMVIGGFALGAIVRRYRRGTLIGVTIFVIGLALALMGIAPTFSAIMALSFLIGLFLIPGQASLSAMMQILVPDLKRGRVSSALNATTTAAGLVSMAFASAAGEFMGLRLIYVILGLITAFAGVLGWVTIKDPTPVGQEQPAA